MFEEKVFNDVAMIFLSGIITLSSAILLTVVWQFNYEVGFSLCNFLNIPPGVALCSVTVGFDYSVAMLLTIGEIAIICWLFPFFEKFVYKYILN